jgi:hypothetical protein
MDRCDRCAIADDTVSVETFCEICGPTPLCSACCAIHKAELTEAVDW